MAFFRIITNYWTLAPLFYAEARQKVQDKYQQILEDINLVCLG